MAGIAAAIAAGAAAAAAATGLYSAVESKKAAEEQKDAADAAFSDDIEAAVTNARWKLVDDKRSFFDETQMEKTLYESATNSLWDTLNNKTDYEIARTNVSNLLTSQLASADIDKLISTNKAQASNVVDSAKLQADYAIAMGEYAANTYTTKAALDATEYLAVAEAGLQFLDNDVSTIKTQLNRVVEDISIGVDEAAGQVLVSTANSFNSGGSSARKLQQTYIKADRMKNASVSEQEDALSKAYGMATKTAKETGAKTSNVINTAAMNATRAKMEALASAQNSIARGKLDVTQLQEVLKANVNNINASTAATIQATNSNLYATTTKDLQDTLSQYDKYTADYSATALKKQQDFEYSNLMTTRSLEQSLITGMNKGEYKAQLNFAAEFADFYNNTPEYYEAKEQYGWGAETYDYEKRATDLLTRTDVNNNVKNPANLQYTAQGQRNISNIFTGEIKKNSTQSDTIPEYWSNTYNK